MFLSRFIPGLYRVLTAAVFPFLLLYVVWRGMRDRRYFRHVLERFGVLPASFQRTVPDSVWLHAVSVGEVLSSTELIRRLRTTLPGVPVFVSCSTLAGRDTAEARLADLVDGIFYAPFDTVFAVRSVIRRLRPAVVVVLETEIWPNLYREVKRAGCALVVVNGRISDKAYPAYRRHSWFFRHVLALPDDILTQSERDVERYQHAGAPTGVLRCGGNLKYDFQSSAQAPPEPVRQWCSEGRGPLWVAASTVAPEFPGDVDEDDAVIEAWRHLPGVRLLLAPRKPERFDAVAAKLDAAGIRYARRSALPLDPAAPVLLLDSLGELGSVFPLADVVFMGGSLAHRGGHNILEPALAGRAVITGPHLENFAEIQQRFRHGRGFVEIAAPEQLRIAVEHLLDDEMLRFAIGNRARLLAESERGAASRAAEVIAEARWRAVPVVPAPLLLRFLSLLWTAGGSVKRAVTRTGRLSAPVISVGGIAMGGSGKTPVVRALARALREDGLQPAVLTRGYRRRSSEPVTVLPAGSQAPASRTGDEAGLILRDGHAHVGIEADRYRAGLALEQQLRPDVFLLDDGFQHARLHRDLDVVVLDGLDPFAGGRTFPAGRLREPISALRRADIILISRTEGRRFDGVIQQIRLVNPQAKVLLSRTEIGDATDLLTRGRISVRDLESLRILAFCGIGNPEAFRRTLEAAGLTPAAFRTFRDHHRYTREEMQSLAAEALACGAGALVTTEKDAVNLPEIAGALPSGLRLISIAVEATLDTLPDRAAALLSLTRKR